MSFLDRVVRRVRKGADNAADVTRKGADNFAYNTAKVIVNDEEKHRGIYAIKQFRTVYTGLTDDTWKNLPFKTQIEWYSKMNAEVRGVLAKIRNRDPVNMREMEIFNYAAASVQYAENDQDRQEKAIGVLNDMLRGSYIALREANRKLGGQEKRKEAEASYKKLTGKPKMTSRPAFDAMVRAAQREASAGSGGGGGGAGDGGGGSGGSDGSFMFNIEEGSRKPGDMVCPMCAKQKKGDAFPLRYIFGTDSYHCNSCGNTFVYDSKGHLVPVHIGEEIPEICPVCRSNVVNVRDVDLGGVKVHRIQCTNRYCRGGRGQQPWYEDLNDADYGQWMDLRKISLSKDNMERLKYRVGYNKKPKPNDRVGLRIKREIERNEKLISDFGTSDVKWKRLGLIADDVDEKSDEYKSQSEALWKEFGLGPEDVGRFHDAEQFKKTSDEHDEKLAQDKSKEHREEKNVMKKAGLDFAGNLRRNTSKATSAGIVELIGIIIGAVYGWPFLVAATCLALRRILPDGTGYEMQKDFEKYTFGSLFATRQNRYNSGLGATKSILKVSALLFAGIGMFGTELPFRGLMLLVFFFIAYFSLPAEYNPSTEPYKSLEGIGKPVIAVILSFWVFGGIFLSKELQWLCMAFFCIFPVATERENIARSIGILGSGTGAIYENLDKVIFVVFMIIGYIAVMGGSGLNLDFLMGTQATVFFFFWIIAGVGGIMSPAATRPYTGIMMLAMVFLFYSSGTGEQIVGQGFFGAWWPTVHNAVTSMTTPFGEAFGAIGETFGSTFKLLTNPVDYAKDIMEGSYEKNPTGATGAYGVEINDFVVPAIQPGTLSMVTFTIRNEGPAKARNVNVAFGLPSYLEGVIAVGHGDDVGVNGYITTNNAVYNPGTDTGQIEEFIKLEPEFAVPLLFMIDARDCVAINKLGSELSRLSKRNEYVRLNVSVEYDYESSSWIPVEMISVQEWQDRTAKGTFAPVTVGSHVSTSPAKLSLGTFAQPIVAGRKPFYIGLNMTSEEGPNSEILWESEKTLITLELPHNMTGAENFRCTPKEDGIVDKPAPTSTRIFTWKGTTLHRGPIYCTSLSPADMNLPSKTFFARANATFRFRKWVYKDTLFSFGDVCFPTGAASLECNELTAEECRGRSDCELVAPAPTDPAAAVCKVKIKPCNTLTAEADCNGRTDCDWVTPPGSTTASCTDKPAS